jgi:ABC-type antimicrobial peptide transport system permease subunit
MGMINPVGKKISDYTITGVLKDFYAMPPTLPIEPMMFIAEENHISFYGTILVVKYKEGAWNELKQQVDSICAPFIPFPGFPTSYRLQNVEEEYDKALVSEYMLIRLLGITSLTCVLIAMFGVFSLVSLSCEQRRKEIAIRKVNGAKIRDILALFAREYLLILVAAAVVAFPVGYVLMKRWLQSYVQQTPISWWLYVAIFAAVALLIAVCIGWRVWRAARSNPADAVKTE